MKESPSAVPEGNTKVYIFLDPSRPVALSGRLQFSHCKQLMPKARPKKAPAVDVQQKPKENDAQQQQQQHLLPEERDLLLSCRSIFDSTLSLPSAELHQRIQNVKSALYDRQYELAFSTDVNCRAYCARWVPSRALMYRRLLSQLDLFSTQEDIGEIKWVLLGGGPGSELLALSSLMSTRAAEPQALHTLTIDSADWSPCYEDYANFFTPKLGRENWTAELQQLDILKPEHQAQLFDSLKGTEPRPRLFFTLFFTLHELLLASRASTIAFLRQLTDSTKTGDRLFVVESASLGTVKLGTGDTQREYSLTWLLKHLMASEWTFDEDEMCMDSQWFRLPVDEALKVYPIKLENARVLVRLLTRK